MTRRRKPPLPRQVAEKRAAPCTCAECRALDREHPMEGIQLRLLPDLFVGAA
jgi:hypothetical protein